MSRVAQRIPDKPFNCVASKGLDACIYISCAFLRSATQVPISTEVVNLLLKQLEAKLLDPHKFLAAIGSYTKQVIQY